MSASLISGDDSTISDDGFLQRGYMANKRTVAMKIFSGRQHSISYLGNRNLDYLIRSNQHTGTDNRCKLMQVSVTTNTAINRVRLLHSTSSVSWYLPLYCACAQGKAATRKHSNDANHCQGCPWMLLFKPYWNNLQWLSPLNTCPVFGNHTEIYETNPRAWSRLSSTKYNPLIPVPEPTTFQNFIYNFWPNLLT